MLLYLRIGFFVTVIPTLSAFQYARCFKKLERHSIDNSQPLTEIFRTTQKECMEQCISHTGNGDEQEEPGYCRAVVYDHLQHSCRLFDHDGRKVPAVIHPANGFDMYRRTSSMQECVGPIQRLLALNARRKGAALAAPSQHNSDKGKTPISIPKSESNSNLPAPPATHPASQNAEEMLEDEELADLLDQLDQKGDKAGPNNQEAGGQVIGELECGTQGRATAFLTHNGVQPTEGAEEFMGWSEQDCAQFCASNLNPEGTAIACAGFTHIPGGSKCFLHSKVPSIRQTPAIIAPYAGIYAEKWCVPTHRYGICRESVHFPVRFQQRFALNCVPLISLGQINTLTECLNRCMDQLGCQTASFHSPSHRCLLYSQQPIANMIIPSDQGWSLIQNGCAAQFGKTKVGAIDSENGQMDAKAAEISAKFEGPKGQRNGAVQGGGQQNGFGLQTPAKAFAQNVYRPCADGGGMMMNGLGGMGRMFSTLFGK